MATAAEKLYKSKVTYFERPIISNEAYDYKLTYIKTPFDFTVRINDAINSDYEKDLKFQLERTMEALKKQEKGEDIFKIESSLFYVGMPVVVKVDEKEAGAETPEGSLVRGQVMEINKMNVLQILRVDLGGVITRFKDDVLAIHTDTLRVPKLGISCVLAQVRPGGGVAKPGEWATDRDYAKDFVGVEKQTITFMDGYPEMSLYDCVLVVDGVNLAVKYFHEDVALPVELEASKKEGRSFLVQDFTPWLGLKVIAFGVKVYKEEGEDGKLKVKAVLQMDPERVNAIQDKIANYIAVTPDAVKKAPFEKEAGTPCLSQYIDEYFRATILGKEPGDMYLIEYVDYKETKLVPGSELLPLPVDLLQYPEGAVKCQITDLLMAPGFNDYDKLVKMIEDKDLYAVVDAFGHEDLGDDLLVSLFEPVDFTGPDKSFRELLGIAERPSEVREILQVFEPVPKGFDSIFLTNTVPTPEVFHEGVMISIINSWDSFFILFPNDLDAISAISSEMLRFYRNGGCTDANMEEFMGQNQVGNYVAAKMDDSNDDILYRCRVMEEHQDGKLVVFYLDNGDTAKVEKASVWPLHKYFIKDPLQVLEVMIKF